MVIDKIEFQRWFPATEYYATHAERLVRAFSSLPPQPDGFSCLSIGSWGAEGPFLRNVMKAGNVVCVRAPEEGVPKVERRTVAAPDGLGECVVTLHALNIETETLPWQNGEFDLVLIWEVLEHLCLDPAFMVANGAAALKVGGIISLTTPNALFYGHTIAQLFGKNPLGLQLQHHIPFATHWRLYSPAEVSELLRTMGCAPLSVGSFLDEVPCSFKSRLVHLAVEGMRRRSGNGACSLGRFVHVIAKKVRDAEVYRPEWLYPRTRDAGRTVHLDH